MTSIRVRFFIVSHTISSSCSCWVYLACAPTLRAESYLSWSGRRPYYRIWEDLHSRCILVTMPRFKQETISPQSEFRVVTCVCKERSVPLMTSIHTSQELRNYSFTAL